LLDPKIGTAEMSYDVSRKGFELLDAWRPQPAVRPVLGIGECVIDGEDQIAFDDFMLRHAQARSDVRKICEEGAEVNPLNCGDIGERCGA
jgi:hypothetical protein